MDINSQLPINWTLSGLPVPDPERLGRKEFDQVKGGWTIGYINKLCVMLVNSNRTDF